MCNFDPPSNESRHMEGLSSSEVLDIRVVTYSSLASIVFLTWNTIVTLDDEIEHVWKLPRRSWMKWLFLFTRHVGVLSQILLFPRNFWSTGWHSHICRAWFIFESLITRALILCVEAILMMRVYAVYNQRRWVAVFLSCIFVVEIGAPVAIFATLLPRLQFIGFCSPAKDAGGLIFVHSLFGLVMVLQTVLWVMTLIKSISAMREGWGRIPIILLIVRDGSWAFTLIFVLLIINSVLYLSVNPIVRTFPSTWLISILAFSSCRLVLNMFHLGCVDELGAISTFPLTTNIEYFGSESFEMGCRDAYIEPREHLMTWPWKLRQQESPRMGSQL